ncbi:pectin methyl esterase [Lyophyllum atratum]|nr:pectin methyl esterase [Lyophyllum atratum]
MRFLLQLASFLLCAIPAALALTAPPAGSKIVRQAGTQSGEYSTVSAAVASLSGTSSAVIFIYPGTYKEQVLIEHGGPLTIYGYSTNGGNYKSNQVTITNNLNAQDNGGNDPCATVRAHSANFKMYNINIKNTYGAGKQATALSAKATRQGYYGCSFTGYQERSSSDTLLADGALNYQYYGNCYIEGAVDYIYGGASAWFGECAIASVGGGAITANSRQVATDPSYYVIDSSTITSNTATSLVGKVYLGRPWRGLARVVFQRSVLPDLINAAGWTTLAVGATPIFQEYGNTGAGASTSGRVTETPLSAQITQQQVLGSDYASWTDTSF